MPRKKKPELSDTHIVDFNPMIWRLKIIMKQSVDQEKYEIAGLAKKIIDLVDSDLREMESEEVDSFCKLTEELLEKINK